MPIKDDMPDYDPHYNGSDIFNMVFRLKDMNQDEEIYLKHFCFQKQLEERTAFYMENVPIVGFQAACRSFQDKGFNILKVSFNPRKSHLIFSKIMVPL